MKFFYCFKMINYAPNACPIALLLICKRFPAKSGGGGSCIDPDLCEEYINKELNEELLPVLRHKSYAQNFVKVIL